MIVTLLKHLDRTRFQLAVGVVDTRRAVFRDEIPSDVELIDLGATRVRYALLKIATLVWTRRPDVVFSTLGHLNLVLAMLRPLLPNNVRYVARETNTVSSALQEYEMPALWAALYRWFYKRHDRLVCQCRYMQDDLVERFGYPKSRSVVINNPVDIAQIARLATVPIEQAVFSPARINLIAAGRMTKQKGFDILIEAVAIAADPRIHLVLLGEGPLLDDLKHLCASLDIAEQVEFVGFQSNPYAWFAKADALVLSSRYEGFPNVVLEALACGTPVISTPSLGGVQEILENIPECVTAAELTASSLAEAISRWCDEPRRRVDSVAIAPYAIARIVGKYQELLA